MALDLGRGMQGCTGRASTSVAAPLSTPTGCSLPATASTGTNEPLSPCPILVIYCFCCCICFFVLVSFLCYPCVGCSSIIIPFISCYLLHSTFCFPSSNIFIFIIFIFAREGGRPSAYFGPFLPCITSHLWDLSSPSSVFVFSSPSLLLSHFPSLHFFLSFSNS